MGHLPNRINARPSSPVGRVAPVKRLFAIDEQLATADPLNRLHLVQERLDLARELASSDCDGADFDSRKSRRPSSRLLPHVASERGSPTGAGGLPASNPGSSKRLALTAGRRSERERRLAHGQPGSRHVRVLRALRAPPWPQGRVPARVTAGSLRHGRLNPPSFPHAALAAQLSPSVPPTSPTHSDTRQKRRKEEETSRNGR
jgi:hypothetical protein